MRAVKLVVALVMFVGGMLIIWYVDREGGTLEDALTRAYSVTVELTDLGRIDPAFDGKMVHATGSVSLPVEMPASAVRLIKNLKEMLA